MDKNLSNWAKSNNLNLLEISPNLFEISEVGEFLLLEEKADKIIDSDMNLIISKGELDLLESRPNLKKVLFNFGGRYYYTDFILDKFYETNALSVKFNDFKYLGKKKNDLDLEFVHLGVHSEYELLNGSRLAEDWVKKAKFLEHKSLAIIDRNTLGGTLSFQLACDKAKIKPIIGETIVVGYGQMGDNVETNELVVFAKNEKGWKNLLLINKFINIDNNGFIWEKELKECSEGIVCVLSKESVVNKLSDLKTAKNYIKKYSEWFDDLYYQLDSVDYFDDYKYKEYASSIYEYLHNFYPTVKPILIGDSYYLDEEESVARTYLNDTKRVRHALSSRQHYKSVYEHVSDFYKNYSIDENRRYGDGSNFLDVIQEAISNTLVLDRSITFRIETSRSKLPKFEHEDVETLFFKELQRGLSIKVKKRGKDVDKYIERIEAEAEVIVNGGFVDYFMILWDLVKWAKSNGIGVGVARGSVGGSLIAYLLDIIDIDPIQHDLLFERFLNKTRVMPEKHYTIEFMSGEVVKKREGQPIKLSSGKEIIIDNLTKETDKNMLIKSISIELLTRPDQLPDIDLDFATAGKDNVKSYLKEKYGKDYVCSVGTYNTSRIKGAIKDFARADGMPFFYVNTVTKFINHRLEDTWEDIFSDAMTSPVLRKFIMENPALINSIKHILNQAKVPSIHASAVIIVPKKDHNGNDMNIFDWMPMRKIVENGEVVLISEWEGKYLDKAGFLKEDILGLSQLDKFSFIQSLIKKLRGEEIILADIPLDDKNAYDLLSAGYNEDVFQMGSFGLKRFCKMVKPDNIEDITAINALWRPGPMRSNAHFDYADIKHGKKKASYDYMLKEVTQKTHGLYVYQEQIMKAVHVLGKLTLAESDEVRTIMKKFDKVKMATFKDKFIKGALENGCPEVRANNIWEKLERFSGYGFNKSHSAAYGLMTYWCAWLKTYYPEEFYTSSLNYSQDEVEVIQILDEIESRKLRLKVFPPDINMSNSFFYTDIESSSIYWSLLKIKGLADKSVTKILSERKKKKFSSIEDFLDRMNGTGIGMGLAKTLVISGSFDGLANIDEPRERRKLLLSLCKTNKEIELFETKYPRETTNKNYVWTYEQKALTGFGKVDYRGLLRATNPKLSELYLNPDEFLIIDSKNKKSLVAGRIVGYIERNSKRGKFGVLTIECNNKMLRCVLWSDVWTVEKKHIENSKKNNNLVAIIGRIGYDDYSQCNALYSDSELTQIIDL